jgi:hypothetical protein
VLRVSRQPARGLRIKYDASSTPVQVWGRSNRDSNAHVYSNTFADPDSDPEASAPDAHTGTPGRACCA